MEEQHCGFWLPNKRRFCANAPLPNSSFCGNHNPSSKEERVPCPIDPSHSVFKGNLHSHVKRCPLMKQVADLESQPFYKKGINSGRGCSHETEPSSFFSSEEKRKAIFRLTVPEFHGLISRIKSIRSAISTGIRDSYFIPEACSIWMKQMHSRQLPFQEKHVLQQASVLGNMESLGVAAWSETAVVEFGAGRGYLTHMLADCYGTRKVFLVERRSYKLKEAPYRAFPFKPDPSSNSSLGSNFSWVSLSSPLMVLELDLTPDGATLGENIKQLQVPLQSSSLQPDPESYRCLHSCSNGY